MERVLYDYFRSSASCRVRIALNLKGLPYDLQEVHLVKDGGQQHTVDYLALIRKAVYRLWLKVMT